MKQCKRIFFLLLLLTGIACKKANAQTTRDSVFTFYFNTNKHITSPKQQKDFETFLQKVQRITAVKGFTDTTGPVAHNEVLSLWRALDVYNNLPKTWQQGVTVVAEGETQTGRQLWQNRRTEVVAVLMDNNQAETTNHQTTEDTSNVTELNIEQIFFLPDQPVLTEASMQYMQTLAQQLLQFEGAHFQIVGHVNYQSKLPPERLPDLYELSENRAKAVYNLLVQNGISPNRMSYKGVGNSQPVIASPTNDDERKKNMRVQVLIIKQ